MADELDSLSYIPIVRKTGNEVFERNGQDLGITLLDFWKWSASDLIGNAERGVLAEYIVASALGIAESVQGGWAAYDLETHSGIKIEVKSGAYIQSWPQTSFSTICFSIPAVNKLGRSNQRVGYREEKAS